MTVDVEDYFQVSAFRHVIRPEDWDNLPSRVELNTLRALDLFAKFGVRATFFILGWVADRFPSLVREIQSAGHELGCHSYSHRLLYELTRQEFRTDTLRALRAIENAAGVAVRAYRAPSFSITPRSIWAIPTLMELGMEFDSSIFPVRHDLYGFETAPRRPFRLVLDGSRLLEFPPPTIGVGRFTFPLTGGGYLRLLPLSFQVQGLRAIENRGQSALVYFHPWELDPEQPRISAPLRSRVRHYTGLDRTEKRLGRLLQTFRFGTLSEAIRTAEPLPEVEFSRDRQGHLAILPVSGPGLPT